MCGSEILMLWTANQKYQGCFEMWCWRKKEKISWTDRMKNELLHRDKEDRNVIHTVKTRTGNSVTSCLGTAFYNTLLKEREKERRDRKTRKKR